MILVRLHGRIGSDAQVRPGCALLHQFLGRDETRENDHVNLALRQIGQLAGRTIIPTIREADFDSDTAFGLANVSKTKAD
jgi:hypothetical protein